MNGNVIKDARTHEHILPENIALIKGNVKNACAVLKNAAEPQIGLSSPDICSMSCDGDECGLLIDFGKELQGGIEIFTSDRSKEPLAQLRVRFGESAMEALAEFGEKNTTNDHAIRDSRITPPWLGSIYVGNTGFRFVYLSLDTKGMSISLKTVRADNIYTGEKKLGSFRCSDETVNRIFDTALYTVTLNMQDYVWDGVKRDRLVWIGDMHPEVLTVRSAFGDVPCLYRSLDYTRYNTPLPGWMNTIPAYSLWWIVILAELYRYSGKQSIITENIAYMSALVSLVTSLINEEGICECGNYFLDWPSSDNPEAQKAGFHALLKKALSDAASLLSKGGDEKAAALCNEGIKKIARGSYNANGNKPALALMSLSGLTDSACAAEMLAENGAHGFSTFLGGYILRAMSAAGKTAEAIDCMKQYWGSILDLGATTFWEDFDLDWAENACPVTATEIPQGKKDIHGDYGNYCYKGYRHSLCHGWSSGPVSFLIDCVMGIECLEPGFKKVKITPRLGGLSMAECEAATPYGAMYVKHELINGKTETTVKAPKEITVI